MPRWDPERRGMKSAGEAGGHGHEPVPSPAFGARAAQGEVSEAFASTRLANGIEVLSEHIEGVRSAAVGVWVRQGSAHEDRDHAGVSHLLEHLVFKGTRRRSARDIALALEGLGGSLDAYTSREHTGFQARVLDEHLPIALDVLADLTLEPALRDDDLDLEREVVLEEIAQMEDTPDDVVFELHGERMWRGHPYGRSILGSRESVAAMTASRVRALHRDRYRGVNLIVAAAGNVRHEAFAGQVDALFGQIPMGEAPPDVGAPQGVETGQVRTARDSSQVHVVFGAMVPGHADPRRYAFVLLSSALGGGMSSRLFQKVREELGLCYSVYTFQSFYSQAGVMGVYVGTRPGWVDRAVDAIRMELDDVATRGLPPEELEQTKRQVKGQIMLSLESTGSRLHRLASFALHDEPFLGLDGLLERIDAVTPEELAAAAALLHPDRHLVLSLGPSTE